ncbi:PspC domain-containing protein [Ruminococcaceae bacterium OttesenSCG-928-I18]|nr:PspC domain-containing protein [Ruminococcaceae bacterium OttesenSCG-928-I18]
METKRLYRSRSNRWLTGVCGGVAEYFNMDPTVVRVIFVLLACFLGSGLLAYIIASLIIPGEPG